MDGIKIFSATKARDRGKLGEEATNWLEEQSKLPGFEVVDKIVTQSSDNEFHCLTLTLFYKKPSTSSEPVRRGPRR